jgi:diguanylate cyclase (GGDEF)-like protein
VKVSAESIKILLVEDDEDDFILARSLLNRIDGRKVELEWVANYQDALRAIERGSHDVYLVDYFLGERNGLELLREAMDDHCTAPMIMFTSHTEYAIDTEAMKAGAADYLIKGQVNAHLMERCIRYALERARLIETLRNMASHDELTGLYNRRAFNRLLKEEADRYQRYDRPSSLLMLDVDNFKAINDSYGHLVGDDVLRWLAGVVRESVRIVDMPARFGGEELAVILPEMNSQQALKLAERLRRCVASRPFSFCQGGRSTQLPVTISLGVAALPADATTADNLIASADRGLYAAKRGGRNRAIRFCDLPEQLEATEVTS